MAEYYKKRPLWQWVAIYLVIGAVVYGIIYYFFLGNRGGYSTGTPQQNVQQSAPGY